MGNWCCRCRRTLGTLSLSAALQEEPAPEPSPLISEEPAPEYCEICTYWLNSPTQMEDHKIGKKHRKNARRYRPRGNESDGEAPSDRSSGEPGVRIGRTAWPPLGEEPGVDREGTCP